MEQNPQDEQVPQGEIHKMEDDIRASMPQVELSRGGETLTPPLPRLELTSSDDFAVPQVPGGSDVRKKKILSIVLVLVVLLLLGGGGTWYWMYGGAMDTVSQGDQEVLEVLEEPSNDVLETPDFGGEIPPLETGISTTMPIPTETSVPEPAGSVLSGAPLRNFKLSSLSSDAFLEAVHDTTEIPESGIILLSFSSEDGSPILASPGDFSNLMDLKLPPALLEGVTAWNATLYNSGSEERSFCTAIKNSECAGKRLGLILKVSSGSSARTAMRDFEAVAQSSLKPLILPAINPSRYSGFKDAEYRGIRLRYFNFPIVPEETTSSIASLNYAVVTQRDVSYLVIGTSRLSFYKMINMILSSN